jgi:hypothetical protein
MLRHLRALAPLASTVASATALLLHAYVGSYSRYIADDFCSAATAHRFGILRATWYWYRTWTGRYSASALDAVFGALGPGFTAAGPAAALILWLAALAFAIRTLLANVGVPSLRRAWMISAAIAFATLAWSPNIAQSLYWGQGMRAILPPLVLSAFLVGQVSRLHASALSGSRRALWLGAILVLTFAAAGFSETYAALQLGVFSCSLLVVLLMLKNGARRPLFDLLCAGVLGAAAGLGVVALSPGNPVRQAFYPNPLPIPNLLGLAASHYASFLADRASDLDGLLAVGGAAALLAYCGARARNLGLRGRMPLAVILTGFALAFATFVPAAYGLSDFPPERTLLLPVYLLTISALVGSFMVGNGLVAQGELQPSKRRATASLVLAAAGLSIAAAFLSAQELVSSLPVYAEYARHWDAVDAQIRGALANGETEVWIQPIANWAGLNEPNDNPKFWVNDCMSDYYGIRVLAFDLQ